MAESLKVKNALDIRLQHSISLLNEAENELEAGKEALKNYGKSPVEIAADENILVLQANVDKAQANVDKAQANMDKTQANMDIAKAISDKDEKARLEAVVNLRTAELLLAELRNVDLGTWKDGVTKAQNELYRYKGIISADCCVFCGDFDFLVFWYNTNGIVLFLV